MFKRMWAVKWLEWKCLKDQHKRKNRQWFNIQEKRVIVKWIHLKKYRNKMTLNLKWKTNLHLSKKIKSNNKYHKKRYFKQEKSLLNNDSLIFNCKKKKLLVKCINNFLYWAKYQMKLTSKILEIFYKRYFWCRITF